MSRKNNVNPDYYKTAGRDRPNEVVPPARPLVPRRRKKGDRPAPNAIPGAPPVGERADSEADERD